jgi:hypothetical protein
MKMRQKKSVLILVLILVIVSSASSVYGQKGLSWLQETFLPQPKENVLMVSGKIRDGDIILKWETDIGDVTSFAVVISRSNSTPRYPDDGHLCLLSSEQRSYTVDLNLIYQGGDADGPLQTGQVYYFGITAIAPGGNTAGNGVPLKIPEPVSEEPEQKVDEDKKPESDSKPDQTEKPKETIVKKPKPVDPLPKEPDPEPEPKPPVSWSCRAWVKNDVVKMDWTIGEEKDFQGYKVVISDTNKEPSYPQDGYLYWITKIDQNYAIVDNNKAYNGGSINGYLQPGKTYYFAVTYIYKDRKVTTPAVKLTTPDTLLYPQPITYVSPEITDIQDEANAVNFNILIHYRWDGDPTHGFKGLKAEITDLETNQVTHQYLGSTTGTLTLYCDGSGKEPTIEPYRYYKVRIIAIYEGKWIYSDYSRPVRSYGDTC